MSIGSPPPQPTRPEEPGRSARAANLGYAAVAGQAGCFTLGIILVSLFAGIALDAHFGLRGPFTIGLLLFSIPISLFMMVRIALGAVGRISPPRRDTEQVIPPKEENR
ncbi:MAG: AtpZ/AtpI family protein [Chloroflexota bacterium]|nr:AtpZ/AtpI family protein [Chloroflexota bacterium]